MSHVQCEVQTWNVDSAYSASFNTNEKLYFYKYVFPLFLVAGPDALTIEWRLVIIALLIAGLNL